MIKEKDIWQQITNGLRSVMPPPEFETWVMSAHVAKWEPDRIEIRVPNKYVAIWLKDNYYELINTFIKKIVDSDFELTFIYDSPRPPISEPSPDVPSASAPRGLPHRLNPSLCFECFVTADFNRFARASAWHVASNPGGGYNPLYVFSRTGLGKTHLLNAIGNHVLQQSPSTRVRLLAADQFLSDLAAARTQRALSSYLEECLRLDLLLFDDVHVLGGRTNSQKALVHLFDGFVESARQVVFTSNNTPRNIANLLPSLQSRLESGVLCEIGVPDEQAKYRIVMQKALAKGIRPSKDVALLLASSGNDFKTVAGYVTALEAHMSLTRRQVDLPTVRRLLKNRHSRDMGIADIQKLTAGYFNIPLSDLLSNKKSHRYSYPRQVAMYLARNLTQVSLNQIGQAFGKRDHTTVLYALKRIETARQKPDSGVSEDLGRIEAMFYA